jgi:hypothetical protein
MNNYDEQELLNNPNKLSYMNNILRNQQFSEDFLIKTNGYYDSWVCLRSQNNLSPYFCFRYLYDNKNDSADNWTDYYDVIRYLNNHNITDTKFIEQEFKRAMNDREKINEH